MLSSVSGLNAFSMAALVYSILMSWQIEPVIVTASLSSNWPADIQDCYKFLVLNTSAEIFECNYFLLLSVAGDVFNLNVHVIDYDNLTERVFLCVLHYHFS